MPSFNLTQDVWTQIIIGGNSTIDQQVSVNSGRALISLGTPRPDTTVIDSGSFDDKVLYVPAGVSVYARGTIPMTTVVTGNYGGGASVAGYQLFDKAAGDRGIIPNAQTQNYAIYASFRGASNKSATGVAQISDAPDLSGYGGEVNVMLPLGVAAWANPGYLTTGAGAGLGASIQKRKVNFDLASDCVIVAFVINMATPGVVQQIMGNGSLASGSNRQGISFQANPTGKLGVTINTSNGDTSAVVSNLTTKSTVLDSADHAIVVAIDGPKGDVYLYVDGVLEGYALKAFSGNTQNIVSNWNIGTLGLAAGSSLSAATTVAVKLKGALHFIKRTGGLPLNISELARKHASSPTGHFSINDTKAATKYIYIQIGGQSNELGSAEKASASALFAAPMFDPLPGLGGVGSEWPKLSSLMARRGIWAQFGVSAVGGTSVVHNWVGVLRSYTNGQQVTRGTFVLNAGNVYKNTTGAKYNTTPVTTSAAPTHSSGTVTGADNIAWTFMGAARAQDVAGYVYPPSDAYFDPNGYIADMVNAAVAKTGYDEKYIFFRIGQGDAGFNTSRAEFANGLRYIAQRSIAAGLKCILGFVNRSLANAVDDQRYTDNLVPGWQDAVSSLGGQVIAAANLFDKLGLIPGNVAADICPGMKDNSHMNDPTMTMAAEFDDAALVAAGL